MTLNEKRTRQMALSKIKTNHRKCPARVLKKGRCEMDCPFRGEHCPRGHGPAKDLFIDHEGVDYKDGNIVYVWSNHFNPEKVYLEKLDKFCHFHHLGYRIESEVDKENTNVGTWIIRVTKCGEDAVV